MKTYLLILLTKGDNNLNIDIEFYFIVFYWQQLKYIHIRQFHHNKSQVSCQ